MGIRSLNTLIKKIAPTSITEHDIKHFENKILAIDCSILIYKYVHMSKIENSHIIGFANRVAFYMKYSILPVFVFDGIPPPAKKNTLQKRQNNKKKIQDKIDELYKLLETQNKTELEIKEIKKDIEKLKNQVVYVTKYHIDECKKFLKHIGIPYVEAPGEAEKMCVYLKKLNYVDYVVSDDTDTLTFGCERVLKTNVKGYIQQVNLNIILLKFEMSYTEFVDFCILCGCDYCPYVQSIGPQTAYTLIKKYKNIESIIALEKYKFDNEYDFITARKLFNDYSDTYLPTENISFNKNPINVKELTDFLKNLNFKENIINKYIKTF